MNRQEAEAAWKAAVARRDAVAERNAAQPVANNAPAEEVAAWNARQREWDQAAAEAEAAFAAVWEAH